METRPIIELLELLDKHLQAGDMGSRGLCFLSRFLQWENTITLFEHEKIDKYLALRRPWQTYCLPNDIRKRLFWWKRGEIEPRHKFLQKLIKRRRKWESFLSLFYH